MHIRNLIEGVIRVPEALTQKAVKSVLSYGLAYVARYGGGQAQKEAKFIIKELKADRFDADETASVRTMINLAELPDSYRSRIPNSKRNLPVHLYIGVDLLPADSGGEYNKHDKAVYISVSNLPDWDQFMASPYKNLGKFSRSVRAIVEHEYMHAVQHQVFGQDMSVDYLDKDGNIDHPKYHNNEIEFGPLILTYALQFIAELKPNVKQKIRNGDYSEIMRSVGYTQFFTDLRKENPAKWKKAVKYYHGLIVQRIND